MTEKIPRATHVGQLVIGNVIIPCAVLEGGIRVLSQRGVTKALGRKWSGAAYSRQKRTLPTGSTPLPTFVAADNLSPFISDTLKLELAQHILYQDKRGFKAHGVIATLLPQICEVWLKARDAGVLTPTQELAAIQADILMRGFAHIGIIALIDEATGYQEVRAREALEEILQKFISAELMKWVKTFPDEFYQQLFRLRNWQYVEFSVKRPSVAGRITNDIVYERLAPGVLDELKRLTPRDPKGRRKHRYFQRLTEDIGHPKLREHLASVITLMRASSNWRNFYAMLNRALPRWDTTLPMPIDYDDDEDKN